MNKLQSTLTFIGARKSHSFKYEIFQDMKQGNSYFAVLSTQVGIPTDLCADDRNFGCRGVWVQIDGYLRMGATTISGCETECELHFEAMHV